MHCKAHDEHRCRSCSLLGVPQEQQLARKQAEAEAALAPFGPTHWLATAVSQEQGFRNKAKMVVSGDMQAPILGILDAEGRGIDLRDCPLYPPALSACFPALGDFIRMARIAPYDVPNRRGELKYILITLAEPSEELMLRFVLRSREALPRIRKHLPTLLDALPGLRVVSANLQPEHKAILEGDEEIILTPQSALRMELDGLPLYLRPRSFFQTNTAIATALYAQARTWVDAVNPPALWDLYCGVGGFALHCADQQREVIGIEISADAVASAECSRDELGLASQATFIAGDATQALPPLSEAPPLIIVNPPRRGLGTALCTQIRQSPARWILYSSCNIESLARDLAHLSPFRVKEARLFDMFPHTTHYEVACLLHRQTM